MILSADRQQFLVKLLLDQLWKDDLVDFEDEGGARQVMRRAMEEWVAEQGDIDEIVRKKILSLKRSVVEGSSEYMVLYRKYYEEELKRRGQG